MKHLVNLDSKDWDLLLRKKKTMIMRASMTGNPPFRKVKKGDELLFINTKNDGPIYGHAFVSQVLFKRISQPEDSFKLIDQFQNQLQLTVSKKKKYGGKRFLSLLTVESPALIENPDLIKITLTWPQDWVVLEETKNHINL